MASEKQRKVYWQSVMSNAIFIHYREGNFSQITTQGKHAYFKYNKFEICHPKIMHIESPHVCYSADGFASWYCGEFELESFNTTMPRVQVSQVAWHHYLSVT